ncbi:arylsulfatase [Lacihabitans sp. LS3-19]|uniref:arylsulfatase n=1 Tax=Lacihabitans sp. LS3-19 TaxID=2487335 RepID=UPI0020CC03E6|nr:arylsulfatase [Lacihabitans sp. LS3-19]MCP9767844.1 arylsulfatase [Lacihabitans sp. LS3-19]
MKKNKALVVSFILLLFLTSARPESKNQTNPKPNVILILADDMGFADLGCFGSEVNTPNLDKLAAKGIRFTQMHNTSKCFPSRACLLTGLYSQKTGYNKGYKKPMSNAITLGELFKMAGYTTLWSGKHHSTELPTTRGFDHYSGLFEGASNHFNPGRQREGEPAPAQKNPNRPWVLDGKVITPYTPPKDFYTTDAFTDYAIDWLENQDSKDPFFLYMSYTAPHDPLMAWPEDIAKYKGKYLAGYEAIRKARFQKQKDIGLLPKNYPLSKPSFQDWDNLSDAQKEEEDQKMAVYAAMIDRLDQNIGRLLSKIEQMGVAENTLIIFLSDNGASAEVVDNVKGSGEIGSLSRWTSLAEDWANVANVPYRFFKNYSHEGGIKTPMIAYWPSTIKKGNQFSDTPLHLIDLMATFSDITAQKYPTEYNNQSIFPMDGISFLPILKGKNIKREKPLFWEWQHGKAIREGDWKLVAYKDKWALYNLKNDPVEETDLSQSNPKKFQDLKLKYNAWEKETAQ